MKSTNQRPISVQTIAPKERVSMKRSFGSLILSILAAQPVLAQDLFLNGQEYDDVQNTRGNASPGKGASNVGDYTHQDEQINVDPDTGVLRVLRTDQKNLINDYVTATFPLNNVVPREVRNIMRVICEIEGGRAEVIRDTTTHDNWLQVIVPKYMVPYIEEATKSLDVEWLKQGRDGSYSVSYFAKYRESGSLDEIALRYAGDGTSIVDPVLNTTTLRDDLYRVTRYQFACEEFDLPPPQAHLVFKVYEVDTNNDLKLGVDWSAWKNGPGRSLFDLILGGQDSHLSYDNATGNFDPNLGALTLVGGGSGAVHAEASQYLLSANYLLTSAFLDFLRVKGKARVLAQPEIFAFTGQDATWSSVDQVLSFQSSPDPTSANGISPTRLNKVFVAADPNNPPAVVPVDIGNDFSAHNRFLNHKVGAELGITLNVHPVVGTESSEVEMELITSDLAGTTPQGTPIITHNRMVMKIRLVDGQPVVLGGLTRCENIDGSNKAPWLGDIPVLGYLFGQENRFDRRKELVITCVPHFYQGAPTAVMDAVWRDTAAMTTCEADNVPMPLKNCFGFDKWMFDKVEFPN